MVRVDRSEIVDGARGPYLWGTAEGILLSLWGRGEPLVAPDGHSGHSDWLSLGGN
jgi:hypothetical protein